MRKPNTKCSRCKTPVYKRPYEIERAKYIFCTIACYQGRIKSRSCAYCKKEFKGSESNQSFCSSTCVGLSRRSVTYVKNGNKRPRNNTQIRVSKLRKAFDFKECMVEGCDYNICYDIHRFIPGAKGGEYIIGNMFAICPNCHAEATRGMIILEKINDHQLRKE